MAAAKLVEITEWVVACRDPTSHKFLELAISGRADMIVTGDGNLLVLNLFREIPISSQNKAISSQSSPPQIVPNKAFNKISGSG